MYPIRKDMSGDNLLDLITEFGVWALIHTF
jgi:hypothetical protein